MSGTTVTFLAIRADSASLRVLGLIKFWKKAV